MEPGVSGIKESRDEIRENGGQNRHQNACESEDHHAFLKETLYFPIVFGSEVEADRRGDALRETNHRGHENERGVDHGSVGRDAVIPRVAEELQVVADANHRHRDAGHEF